MTAPLKWAIGDACFVVTEIDEVRDSMAVRGRMKRHAVVEYVNLDEPTALVHFEDTEAYGVVPLASLEIRWPE
jgi:hypothetical protein